jgi:hypothetical protein
MERIDLAFRVWNARSRVGFQVWNERPCRGEAFLPNTSPMDDYPRGSRDTGSAGIEMREAIIDAAAVGQAFRSDRGIGPASSLGEISKGEGREGFPVQLEALRGFLHGSLLSLLSDFDDLSPGIRILIVSVSAEWWNLAVHPAQGTLELLVGESPREGASFLLFHAFHRAVLL